MRYPLVNMPSYEETRTNPQGFRLPTDADVRNYLIEELQEAHLFANSDDLGADGRDRWYEIGDEVVAAVVTDDEIMTAVKSMCVALVMEYRRELHDAFVNRLAADKALDLRENAHRYFAGKGIAIPVTPTVDEKHLNRLMADIMCGDGGCVRDGLQDEGLTPAEAAECGAKSEAPVGGMEVAA